MEKMTREEMIIFLKGMDTKEKQLKEAKMRVRSSVETLEDAIKRNSFAKRTENVGGTGGVSTDKVLKILMSSHRDIAMETVNMVRVMQDIYEREDQIGFVKRCLWQLDVTDQQVIGEIYIKQETLVSASFTFNISISQLHRRALKAVDRLLELYNAACQDQESSKAKWLLWEVAPYLPKECFS